MLGLIHRTTLGLGPPHFQAWFYPDDSNKHGHDTRLQSGKHNKQLHDYINGRHSEMLRNSALGLVRVYNNLPQNVVDANSVTGFQHHVQDMLKHNADKSGDKWTKMFSARK